MFMRNFFFLVFLATKRNETKPQRRLVPARCVMARPVAFGEGFPSDAIGSAPGLSAPLSPEALEAHVQAACGALRSGGTLGVLDLRGHPDAGAAIDVIRRAPPVRARCVC